MPRYEFECQDCTLRFNRNLKMGEHPSHACPRCSATAPRLWDSSFGFAFSSGNGAPGNTGVHKDDYPTADHGVGQDAQQKWAEIHARQATKKKVRDASGTDKLTRRDDPDGNYIDYEGLSDEGVEARKNMLRKHNDVANEIGAPLGDLRMTGR